MLSATLQVFYENKCICIYDQSTEITYRRAASPTVGTWKGKRLTELFWRSNLCTCSGFNPFPTLST